VTIRTLQIVCCNYYITDTRQHHAQLHSFHTGVTMNHKLPERLAENTNQQI